MPRKVADSVNDEAVKIFQSELREKRKWCELTQKELAKKIGVSRQTIHFLETGKWPMSRVMMLAIKYAIGEAYYGRRAN